MKPACLLLLLVGASVSTGCIHYQHQCVSRACEGTFRPKPGAWETLDRLPVGAPLPPGVIPVVELEFTGGLFTGCGEDVVTMLQGKAAALGLDGVAEIHTSYSGSSRLTTVSQSGTVYDSASVSADNPSGSSGVGSGGPPAVAMASGPTVYCRGIGYVRP